jgi:hypothetical protein
VARPHFGLVTSDTFPDFFPIPSNLVSQCDDRTERCRCWLGGVIFDSSRLRGRGGRRWYGGTGFRSPTVAPPGSLPKDMRSPLFLESPL